jgi:hypothetical protein
MTINEFREALHGSPFRPFIIHLADGRKIPVPHPDFAMVTGAGRTAHISRPGDEWFTVIDLLLVTQLEVPGGNGAKNLSSP